MSIQQDDIPRPDIDDFDEFIDDQEQKESENLSFIHIDPDELAKIINHEDEYKDPKIELILIDCRFDYEYKQGHIKSARSVNWEGEIESYFKRIKQNQNSSFDNTIIVFYCEFSMNRGPQMASIFRNIDRSLNYQRYPFIYYQNVLILRGGFQCFYQQHPELCEGVHFPMWDLPSKVSISMKKRNHLIENIFANNDANENQKIHFSLSQPIFLDQSLQSLS